MRRLLGVKGGIRVKDVFSTDLYTGTGEVLSVTNGVDFRRGGMVWIKQRNGNSSHVLTDTERGVTAYVETQSTRGDTIGASDRLVFNGDGFAVSGAQGVGTNNSGQTYVSWSFRKARRFFDVVTYTGTGSPQTIAHDLGVAPGMVWVKRRDVLSGWAVYHIETGATHYLKAHANDPATDDATIWNDTAPTNLAFTVGSNADVNAVGGDYVAFLFAHNAAGAIACGSYIGNGAAIGPEVTIGWQPQWLLIKNTSSPANWELFDTARGMGAGSEAILKPNLTNAEATGDWLDLTDAGFQVGQFGAAINASGETYAYMAIRAE